MKVFNDILETIGDTPLIKLENLYKNQKVEIYGKFESLNPGGSIKDRICLNMINKAEEEGLINPKNNYNYRTDKWKYWNWISFNMCD